MVTIRRSTTRFPGGTDRASPVPVQSCPNVSGPSAGAPASSSILSASQSVKPGPFVSPTRRPVQMPKLLAVTFRPTTSRARTASTTTRPMSAVSTTITIRVAPDCRAPNTTAATPGASPTSAAIGNERRNAHATRSALEPDAAVAASMMRSKGRVSRRAWNSAINRPPPSSSGSSANRSNDPVRRPCSAAAPTAAPIAPAEAPPSARSR